MRSPNVRAVALPPGRACALDDGGIACFHSGGFHDVFFTVEGDVRHERGRDHGAWFDHTVSGVTKPVRVLAEPSWTMILEGRGGVAMIPSPTI